MPDHWQSTTIGEACDILDRQRKPVSSAERAKRLGPVPYYGATGIAGWIDEPIFDEPLVLLGEDAVDFASPSASKAYSIDGPSWVNNHAHVLRPKKIFINCLMLELLLNAVDYTNYAVFGTRSKLTQASMKSIRLMVPPLPEQRRIVDLVESIDNYIDALQGQIDATRTARQGVLSELLSNPGDDWQRANLAEVATVVVGPALKSEIYHSCNNGIPVVRGINIGTDGFKWEETVFWPEDECAGYEQFFLTEGQTIIPMDRPFRPNGQLRLATVQQGDLPLLLNQRVAAIAAGPHISDGFLYAIACSPDFANKLSGGLTGAYAPHLAKKDFENMSIAIPSMSEQHQITDLVQSFDEQISALESQVDTARATRSGVLSELLSGDRLLDESYDKAVGW